MRKDAAPFLIMHGDKDDVVPLAQAVKLAEALSGLGSRSRFRSTRAAVTGAAHFQTESWKLIEGFFARHLVAKNNAPR